MNLEQLMALRNSPDAPFDHREYTVWLHNKIVDAINYELWEAREKDSTKFKSTYAYCNHLMNLRSLQTIKQ